jgi:preprotein translocase subunit SecA
MLRRAANVRGREIPIMGMQEVIGNALKKIFGSRNERLLKKLAFFADRAESFESEIRSLSPEALRAKTDEFKSRLAGGEAIEDVMPEAFAVLREASRRAKAHRHFHCQLIGGRVLFENKVAEMRTGEGKTIVCHLATYMKICQGKHVHIVTVNDYLVRRDAEFAAPIFELLGATVGYIQAQQDPGGFEGVRQAAYACNVTYGTNSEFGFDYLRDNMKMHRQAQVQSPLHYCIIDEVDSILIDEARTPLIISGPAHDDVEKYRWADNIARVLTRKQEEMHRVTRARIESWGDTPPAEFANHPKFQDAIKRFRVDPYMLTEEESESLGHHPLYVVQLERKHVGITHDGVQVAQDEAKIGSFYIGQNMDRPHLIEQSLRAHVVYERDKDYVVQTGEVIIVDEFTGRLMIGRQWSDGLHQAVEAKEGVRVKEETQTMATITIQNFFKLYQERAGMTGTALTEADEFMKIYKLDVVEIPTNRPVNRIDHNDKVYRSVSQKYRAIVDEIHEVRRKGRPADPFLLADIFKALKPIHQKLGRDTSRLDEALARFNKAEYGDQATIQFMLEVYDEEAGEQVTGRPVLVGTTSVENSEKLSQLLTQVYGIEHEVLNAKNHAREAEIVVKAGYRTLPTRGADKTPLGNVTIATNMAGRGTDIKLEEGVVFPKCKVPLTVLSGGNGDGAVDAAIERENEKFPAGSTKCCIRCPEYDPATNCAHCYKPKLDPRFPALGRTVCPLNVPCGLHIVGTERHESRRIDNQLRGRSGRQGDPGSSRFSLSLEDPLLKLFMPDWMLKMMEKLGFTEGASLEDKRLSKGIERAQRKVEERNFSSRKHLLEWDEPMDYQRKQYYSARQRTLEGHDIRADVLVMIREAIDDAVERFLAKNYRSRCIAEWCRVNLDIPVDAEKLRGSELGDIEAAIRDNVTSDAREMIQTSTGEYIDSEAPPEEWDVRGLAEWAQRSFKATMTQNQLRKMSPEEITDWLVDAAEKHFASVDLSGVAMFLDPDYPRTMLAEWCRNKFGIELRTADLADKSEAVLVDVIMEHVEKAYHQRELSYPVETVLERSGATTEGVDSSYTAAAIADWVFAKYRVRYQPEHFFGRPPEDIYRELFAFNESFWNEGKFEAEIDAAIAGKSEADAIAWARERFGPAFNPYRFERSAGTVRDKIVDAGKELLRFELSRLEQAVLLRLHDQCWKDHLLEMDHLKTAIMQRPMGGDQSHPQSQYAIEGREFFDQMWQRVRDRVTDMILKVRAGAPAGGQGPAMSLGTSGDMPTQRLQLRKADATNAMFSAAAADQQAAMKAQGVEQKVETIRREQPRVGRNDPCPCGSGKKYKQCHGR